ncbi:MULTISPECIES: PT domain-containing protein [unclassified Streptomyces]|uniref:PT domain-containing protein n=2 Tax=Streptomyces TaxID=1883 RepID=UPI0033CB133F
MQRRSMRIFAVALVGLIALTGCGKKGRSHDSGLGGFVSGGSGGDNPASGPTDLPTGLPSGAPTDLPSGVPSDLDVPSYGAPTPSYTYSAPPTYNSNGTNDISASGCDYDESTHSFQYTLNVRNPETQSMHYSITIEWENQSGGSLLGSDYKSVTVASGSSQSLSATSYRYLTEQTSFTCKVTSALKYPSST